MERTNIKRHNFCIECTKYSFNPDWILFSAVTEALHLPEMAAYMHKEKITKQEGNQAFLPPNPLEDYSEADNDISENTDDNVTISPWVYSWFLTASDNPDTTETTTELSGPLIHLMALPTARWSCMSMTL